MFDHLRNDIYRLLDQKNDINKKKIGKIPISTRTTGACILDFLYESFPRMSSFVWSKQKICGLIRSRDIDQKPQSGAKIQIAH